MKLSSNIKTQNVFKYLNAAVLAGCGLVLSGCALLGNQESQDETEVEVVAAPIVGYWPETRWTVRFGTNNTLLSGTHPLLLEDELCSSGHYRVACYDYVGGNLVWEAKHKGITAGPVLAETNLVVATGEGEVIAYNAKTGQKAWSAIVDGAVIASPAVGETGSGSSVVVVSTSSGLVIGLSGIDGTELWSYEQTAPTLTLRGNAKPTIHDGYALIGFDNGKLVSVSLETGLPRWEAVIGRPEGRSDLDRLVDVDASAVVRRNDVYATAYNTHTRAIDLRTGRELWGKDVSGSSGLAVDTRQLYVTGSDNVLYALDVYSGRIIWQTSVFSDEQAEGAAYGALLSGPAIYKDFILLADSAGMLHGVNRDTGKRTFSAEIGGEYSGVPLVQGDSLILQSHAGTVSVIDLLPLDSDAVELLRSAGPSLFK